MHIRKYLIKLFSFYKEIDFFTVFILYKINRPMNNRNNH